MSNKFLDESDAGHLGIIQTSKWRQKGSMSEHHGSKLHFPKKTVAEVLCFDTHFSRKNRGLWPLDPPPYFIYVCLTPVLHQSWSGSMCWTELHVLSILIRTPLLFMSNEEDIQRKKGKMLISRSKGKNVCACMCTCILWGSRGFDKIQASRFLHFAC